MPVLLGFKDLRINNKEEVDFRTNKFGGLPDWMVVYDVMEYPRCELCSSLVYHLIQIYCPLINSDYHRTLNLFACANKCCWNKPESIVVLRSQRLEVKPLAESKISNDDWGTNEWCSDSWENNNVVAEPSTESTEAISNEVDNISTKFSNELVITDVNRDEVLIPHFAPYHVYVLSEADIFNKDTSVHEMQLYKDYISREGELPTLNEASPSGKSKTQKQMKNAEMYEKTQVKHGDNAFYQFKKKINSCPDQCLRYEWNGGPLLLSNISTVNPPFEPIPQCPYCNSNRIFELQLMPNFVTCLHDSMESVSTSESIRNSDSCSSSVIVNGELQNNADSLRFHDDKLTRVEFGCIYVFTCSASCWNADVLVRKEFAAIQADPDDEILK